MSWKDSLKDTLKHPTLPRDVQWQDTATERSTWRRSIHDGIIIGNLTPIERERDRAREREIYIERERKSERDGEREVERERE